jgi:hypothetical protein
VNAITPKRQSAGLLILPVIPIASPRLRWAISIASSFKEVGFGASLPGSGSFRRNAEAG